MNWKRRIIKDSIIILTLSLILTSCVSRYTPLERIRPLSGTCKDYILFSDSLTKQRDQGFTKRATINISGYAVGSKANKELLYNVYKPIIETIFADYLLSISAVKIFAKVQCEHDMEKNWPLLAQEHYRQVAKVIRTCRKQNIEDDNMEKCLILSMQGKTFKEPVWPPDSD